MRWLDGNIDSVDISLSKVQEMAKYREAQHEVVLGSQTAGHNLATEPQVSEMEDLDKP